MVEIPTHCRCSCSCAAFLSATLFCGRTTSAANNSPFHSIDCCRYVVVVLTDRERKGNTNVRPRPPESQVDEYVAIRSQELKRETIKK